MGKLLLPIPLKYHPDKLRGEGHDISLWMPIQCAICKTWYSIPPDDETEYHYYCAEEACLKKMDDESIRNDERGAAIRQVFANSGMEVPGGYVPFSYRSLQHSDQQDKDDKTPPRKDE